MKQLLILILVINYLYSSNECIAPTDKVKYYYSSTNWEIPLDPYKPNDPCSFTTSQTEHITRFCSIGEEWYTEHYIKKLDEFCYHEYNRDWYQREDREVKYKLCDIGEYVDPNDHGRCVSCSDGDIEFPTLMENQEVVLTWNREEERDI